MISTIFSKKLKAEAQKFNVSIMELVMADLMSIHYTKADAFFIAFPDYASKSEAEARNVMDSIARSDKFKALLQERTRMHNNEARPTANPDGLMAKEEAQQEILNVALSMPSGSKERGDMFVKYMEMLRKNNESIDTGDDHVKYYLPLTCEKCSLYADLQSRRKAKEEAEYKKKLNVAK